MVFAHVQSEAECLKQPLLRQLPARQPILRMLCTAIPSLYHPNISDIPNIPNIVLFLVDFTISRQRGEHSNVTTQSESLGLTELCTYKGIHMHICICSPAFDMRFCFDSDNSNRITLPAGSKRPSNPLSSRFNHLPTSIPPLSIDPRSSHAQEQIVYAPQLHIISSSTTSDGSGMATALGTSPDSRRVISPRPKGRENSKNTLCRNIGIYGHCRYENEGCAFNHDQNSLKSISSTMENRLVVLYIAYTDALLAHNGVSTVGD